jgi:hypothetical protein
VPSLPNLEDMHWREAPLIGRNSWPQKECNLQDLEGVFLVKGRVMTSNPREVILDNIIGMIVLTWPLFTILETSQQ